MHPSRHKKAVYPGVSIGIDELKISVQDMQERVQFVKSVDKIPNDADRRIICLRNSDPAMSFPGAGIAK